MECGIFFDPEELVDLQERLCCIYHQCFTFIYVFIINTVIELILRFWGRNSLHCAAQICRAELSLLS